jgi:TRAP-type uncharacterized transport system substrate-binding protein
MRLYAFILALIGGLLGMSQAQAQPMPTQFCGGAMNGNYYNTMSALANGSFHSAPPLVTNGSMENLDLIDKGRCVAAPAQMDALFLFSAMNKGRWLDVKPLAVVGEEYAHLVCADYVKFPSATGRLANISDLAGRRDLTIAIGQDGSGSNLTWRVFQSLMPYLDPARGGPQVNAIVDNTSQRTLSTVKSTSSAKLDCMFFVSTPNSDVMKRVDAQGATLELININDPAIFRLQNKWGESIYSMGTIAPHTYPNLQSDRFTSFWGKNPQPVTTVKVKSVMVANTPWYMSNPNYARWISDWASHINYTRF